MLIQLNKTTSVIGLGTKDMALAYANITERTDPHSNTIFHKILKIKNPFRTLYIIKLTYKNQSIWQK